jgi:peptide chain release factor 3
MTLDEAPMRALSRRFGLAARLPPNTVQRGVDLAMGPTSGETTHGRAVGTGLDVLAKRLQAEYGLRVTFETSRFEFARWIAAKSPAERDVFIHAHPASVARDLDGAAVFLAASAFDLKYEQDKWPEIVFSDIKDN